MRPTESSFLDSLQVVRPCLVPAFTAALPGARAAVMARLWRALLFEGELAALVAGRVHGPGLRPYDVGTPKGELTLRLEGRDHTHPAELLTGLGLPGSARLVAELDHSVASLALSRANARPAAADDLVSREQSVVDGHPYHPCCRARPGFTVADQLGYAPEHRQHGW
jgi:hypothetical protein